MEQDAKVYPECGEDEIDLRRGPWTVEEDFILINYITQNGEGRWNSLARCAGLKRTGKSCRLRWLNYLRPDVRRGDITLEEQLLILELHSQWGNRWSKIAQHLPGRTDNEIKNYWRTRVQKHAKQLKCDVNSKKFKDTMRYLWMPRLVERIQAAAAAGTGAPATSSNYADFDMGSATQIPPPNFGSGGVHSYTPGKTSAAASSESFGTPVSDLTEGRDNYPANHNQDSYPGNYQLSCDDISPGCFNQGLDFVEQNNPWMINGGDVSESLWNADDVWFLRHQFNDSHI